MFVKTSIDLKLSSKLTKNRTNWHMYIPGTGMYPRRRRLTVTVDSKGVRVEKVESSWLRELQLRLGYT